MGIIKRGILGGFSGKVANVVGTSWKGIAVMKSMPLSVANPNTVAQQGQRTAMSNVVGFGQQIGLDVIRTLNNRWAGQMSGFNAFTKRNVSRFKPGNDLSGQVKMLSSGNYTEPLIESDQAVAALEGGNLEINLTHIKNLDEFSAVDKLYVVISDTAGLNAGTVMKGVSKSTIDIFKMSDYGIVGTPLVWLSVLKADLSQVSNSVLCPVSIS